MMMCQQQQQQQQTPPCTTKIQQEVLSLLEDGADEATKQGALEILQELLNEGRNIRAFLMMMRKGQQQQRQQDECCLTTSQQQSEKKRYFRRRQELLRQERTQWYKEVGKLPKTTKNNNASPASLCALRRISRTLRDHDGSSSSSSSSSSDCVPQKTMIESINVKIETLERMIGPGKKLPWRLRYVTDVDPEKEQDDSVVMDLGGEMQIHDSNGRNVWADYCEICDLEILSDDKEPRWRCCSCGGVQCPECEERNKSKVINMPIGTRFPHCYKP